jgi:hypothetical protein
MADVAKAGGIPFSWGKATTAGLAGIGAAAVVSLIYGLIVNAIFGPPMTPNPQTGDLQPVIAIQYGVAAAVFTILGAFIFIFMMRAGGEKAIRNYIIVGIVGLILSFGTVLQPGIATDDRIILAVVHVVAAAAAIPAMVVTYQRR